MTELKTLASKAAARAAEFTETAAGEVEEDAEASDVVEDVGADSDPPATKADARLAKRAKKEAKRAAREARKRKRAAEEAEKAEKKKSKKEGKGKLVEVEPVAEPPAAKAEADDAAATTTKKEKKKKKKKKKEEAKADDAAPATPPQAAAAADDDDKPTAQPNDADADADADDAAPSGRGGTAARAFKRVDETQWLGKKGSWNNSYEATFGGEGWGAKAQAVLGQVRGKDFRHEKTKKKRGSYRGGAIDPGAVCSYKFDE